jgi:hypothetical protein
MRLVHDRANPSIQSSVIHDPCPVSQEDDPVGQAIAGLTSSASALADLALVSANRDRMANEQDFEIICHALTQIQFVASLVDVRMVANGQIETEDAL